MQASCCNIRSFYDHIEFFFGRKPFVAIITLVGIPLPPFRLNIMFLNS